MALSSIIRIVSAAIVASGLGGWSESHGSLLTPRGRAHASLPALLPTAAAMPSFLRSSGDGVPHRGHANHLFRLVELARHLRMSPSPAARTRSPVMPSLLAEPASDAAVVRFPTPYLSEHGV